MAEEMKVCLENLVTTCTNSDYEHEHYFFCSLPKGHEGPHYEIITDDNGVKQKVMWEKVKE